MKKNAIPLLVGFCSLFFPRLASAQPADFQEGVGLVIDLIREATFIGWMLVFVGFVYGALRFLVKFDNEREREEGKRLMLWSVVVICILVTIWGILTIILNSFFGFGQVGIPQLTPPTP